MAKDLTTEAQASEEKDEAAIERDLSEQQVVRREKLVKLQARDAIPSPKSNSTKAITPSR